MPGKLTSFIITPFLGEAGAYASPACFKIDFTVVGFRSFPA